MTIMEFWEAHDQWLTMEKLRLGITDEKLADTQPINDEEYEKLLIADEKHQFKLKKMEQANATNN